MKKILSGILYGIFFGVTILLLVACIFLIVNTAKRSNINYGDIDAVMIDDKGESDDTEYNNIDMEVSSEMPYGYHAIELKYAYNALDSENKRYLYDKISENIYSVSESADDSGHYRMTRLIVSGERMSEADIREAVNAYIYDNPQIFWLENLFGYAYTEENTIVEFYSVLSAEECADCISLFNKKVDEMINSLQSELSEYEREKILHDNLLSACKYKSGVESSKDGWQYFSAYGAIVTGEAVCEGYAKAMQILLSKAGIPCFTVRGESDGVSHMWNVVELNNEWYHLDATWDDNDKDGFIIYEYFNLDSDNIKRTHKINADIETIRSGEKTDIGSKARYNFFVPLCTSMNMNYYNKEGIFINEFDGKTDARVINEIVQKVNDGEHYIHIKFGDSFEYSEYVNMMFYQSPYKYYYYIDHANELMNKELSKKSISVLKNEKNLSLRVKLITN